MGTQPDPMAARHPFNSESEMEATKDEPEAVTHAIHGGTISPDSMPDVIGDACREQTPAAGGK